MFSCFAIFCDGVCNSRTARDHGDQACDQLPSRLAIRVGWGFLFTASMSTRK